MGPDNPLVVLALVAAMFGYATFDVATAGIDPSQPSFPMFLAFLGTTAGAWWAALRRRGRGRDGMRDGAFLCGLIAGTVGLAVYAGCALAALV